MKIASVADVKARFSAFLKASKRGPVVVTKNGKPAAVLLSVDDEDEIAVGISLLAQVSEDVESGQATDSGGSGYPAQGFLARSRRQERLEINEPSGFFTLHFAEVDHVKLIKRP